MIELCGILAFRGDQYPTMLGNQEHTSIWNSAFEWDNALLHGDIIECPSFLIL